MERARISAAAATLAVAIIASIGLGGCTPFQISPILDRTATISHGTTDTITVTGTISCTRSEPVDLFPTITQGTLQDRPGELSTPCGPVTRRYSVTFDHVAPGFVAGEARMSIDYCTNPGDDANGDCVTVSRLVTLVESPA